MLNCLNIGVTLSVQVVVIVVVVIVCMHAGESVCVLLWCMSYSLHVVIVINFCCILHSWLASICQHLPLMGQKHLLL